MNVRIGVALICFSVALLLFGSKGCDLPIGPSEKATSATYIYEKDDGPIPPAVLAGLNRLNIERNIIATTLDDDVVDGSGDIPEQYKPVHEAAPEADRPALVVLAGKKAINVVKSPTTAEQVWEAVR